MTYITHRQQTHRRQEMKIDDIHTGDKTYDIHSGDTHRGDKTDDIRIGDKTGVM